MDEWPSHGGNVRNQWKRVGRRKKASLRPDLNKNTDSPETQSTFTESKQKHMRDVKKKMIGASEHL